MQIILFILFGFIVGLIARAIMPGRQRMGIIWTTILGMVGSFIGGFLGSLLSHNNVGYLHPAGIIGSIIGALILLALMGWWGHRHGRASVTA